MIAMITEFYSQDCIKRGSLNKAFRMELGADIRPHIMPAKVEFDYMAVAEDQRRDKMLELFIDAKKTWVERCRRDHRNDPEVFNNLLRLVEEAKEVKSS